MSLTIQRDRGIIPEHINKFIVRNFVGSYSTSTDSTCLVLSTHTSSYVKLDSCPPTYPTLVDFTPLVLASKFSTCQKYPAPDVIFNLIMNQ